MFSRLRPPTAAHRALTLLWAMLFVLGGGLRGAEALACPAGHGQGGDDHGSAHHAGHDAPAEHAACTCVGDCHGGASPILPRATVQAAPVTPAHPARVREPLRREHLPGRDPHALPFANAPPRAG